MALEILSPLFPTLFLPIASFANMMKGQSRIRIRVRVRIRIRVRFRVRVRARVKVGLKLRVKFRDSLRVSQSIFSSNREGGTM